MIRLSVGLLCGLVLGFFAARRFFPKETKKTAAEATATPCVEPTKNTTKSKRKQGERAPSLQNQPLTAQDLASESEGDALTLGETHIDFAENSDLPAKLSMSAVQSSVEQRKESLVNCVSSAVGDDEVTGRITLAFIVAPNGRANRVRVTAPRILLRRGLFKCMKRELDSISFGKAAGETLARIPFDLAP